MQQMVDVTSTHKEKGKQHAKLSEKTKYTSGGHVQKEQRERAREHTRATCAQHRAGFRAAPPSFFSGSAIIPPPSRLGRAGKRVCEQHTSG